VRDFISSLPGESEKGKYEIRAFFSAHKGSISEARRLAYYRALTSRNQLLALGVKPQNISVKVSSSPKSEDNGRVNIYLK
jgi:hypothetical protein